MCKVYETETCNALAELAPLIYRHTDTQYHFMYNNSNQLLITILLIGVFSILGMVVSIDSYRFLFSNNQTVKLNKLSSAKVGSEKLSFYSVLSLSQISSEGLSFY